MARVKKETLDTLDTEKRTFAQKDWITKKCDSRRSWICGEGLPFRDHVREKREQRKPQVGFSRLEL